MRFRVGPFEYALRIVADRPVLDGRGVDGLIDYEAETISIYHGVRGRRRLNVLLHELGHAWDYHFAPGTDAEASANHKAAYAQQALHDLDEQGGVAALEALLPVAETDGCSDGPTFDTEDESRADADEAAFEGVRIVRDAQTLRLGTASRADCFVCGRFVYARRIDTGKPYFLRVHRGIPIGGWVVNRAMYCGECGHVQAWIEGVDPMTGGPNGVPIDEPDLLTDRGEVAAWLAEHPHCEEVAEAW